MKSQKKKRRRAAFDGDYCFQVPANRIGYGQFNGAQLKTIQEVITLIVFAVFSVVYLKEPLKWNYLAVFLVFKKF